MSTTIPIISYFGSLRNYKLTSGSFGLAFVRGLSFPLYDYSGLLCISDKGYSFTFRYRLSSSISGSSSPHYVLLSAIRSLSRSSFNLAKWF